MLAQPSFGAVKLKVCPQVLRQVDKAGPKPLGFDTSGIQEVQSQRVVRLALLQ